MKALKRVLTLLLILSILVGNVLTAAAAETDTGGGAGVGGNNTTGGYPNPGNISTDAINMRDGYGVVLYLKKYSNTVSKKEYNGNGPVTANGYTYDDLTKLKSKAVNLRQSILSYIDNYFCSPALGVFDETLVTKDATFILLNTTRDKDTEYAWLDELGGDGYKFAATYNYKVDSPYKDKSTEYIYSPVYESILDAKERCKATDEKNCSCMWHMFKNCSASNENRVEPADYLSKVWDVMKANEGAMDAALTNFICLWKTEGIAKAMGAVMDKVTIVPWGSTKDEAYLAAAQYFDVLCMVSYAQAKGNLTTLNTWICTNKSGTVYQCLTEYLSHCNRDDESSYWGVAVVPVAHIHLGKETPSIVASVADIVLDLSDDSSAKQKFKGEIYEVKTKKGYTNAYGLHNADVTESMTRDSSKYYKSVQSAYKKYLGKFTWDENRYNSDDVVYKFKAQLLRYAGYYLSWWSQASRTDKGFMSTSNAYIQTALMAIPTDTKGRACGLPGSALLTFGMYVDESLTQDPEFSIQAVKAEDKDVVEVPVGKVLSEDVNINVDLSKGGEQSVKDFQKWWSELPEEDRGGDIPGNDQDNTMHEVELKVTREYTGTDQNKEDNYTDASLINVVDKVVRVEGNKERVLTEGVRYSPESGDSMTITISGLKSSEILDILRGKVTYKLVDEGAVVGKDTEITYKVQATVNIGYNTDKSKAWSFAATEDCADANDSYIAVDSVAWKTNNKVSGEVLPKFTLTGEAVKRDVPYNAKLTLDISKGSNSSEILQKLGMKESDSNTKAIVTIDVSTESIKGTPLGADTVCVDEMDSPESAKVSAEGNQAATIKITDLTYSELKEYLEGRSMIAWYDDNVSVAEGVDTTLQYKVAVSIMSSTGSAMIGKAIGEYKSEDETMAYAYVSWNSKAPEVIVPEFDFFISANTEGYDKDNPGANVKVTLSVDNKDNLRNS